MLEPSPVQPRGGWTGQVVGRSAAPLREQVLATIRRAILDFDLQPGQRLVERELIEQTGVSRTTVREVIRELTAEGLVTVVPQRGAVVSNPSPEEAADLYEVRRAVEGLIVSRFVERADDDAVAELRAAVREFTTATAEGRSIHEMLDAKDAFYEVLMTGAGSEALRQILTSLQARVQLLRATSLSMPGRPAMAAAELEELVEAIAARDGERAAVLCTGHIQEAAANGLVGLSQAARASLQEETAAGTRAAP